jgi:hypothetical protein
MVGRVGSDPKLTDSDTARDPEHWFVLQRLTDIVGHQVSHPDAVASERGQPEPRPVT